MMMKISSLCLIEVIIILSIVSVTSFRMYSNQLSFRSSMLNVISITTSDLIQSTTTEGLDREHLIAEEMVTDDLYASLLADRCMNEAKRLFTSQANWRTVEVMDKNIKVETIPLDGGYASSGVHLVRGVGIIPASAKKFFAFQCSREGFQSIDEYLVNHRNVDNFKWITKPEFADVPVPPATEHFAEESPYQLMMNRVEWKYPIKRREVQIIRIRIRVKNSKFVSFLYCAFAVRCVGCGAQALHDSHLQELPDPSQARRKQVRCTAY